MKIAVTIYPLDGMGGIIPNVENQLWGLKELGHEVDFYLLGWQNKFMKGKYSDNELLSTKNNGWRKGCLYPVHGTKGWNFPLERKIPYKGKENIKRAKRILSKYDFIIWQIPVPTRQKANRGNVDWIELYKANEVNVLYCHDCHLIERYPYIYEIKDNIVGVATTHTAGYGVMKLGGIQKALIFSSHNINSTQRSYSYYRREKGFLSLQNFKNTKNTDLLLRSIPYISKDISKHMAGGGREQLYMTSEEKCKPEYYCSRIYDPDLPLKIQKKKMKIWDYAIENNLIWHGWVSPAERDKLLRSIRTLVDLSWGKYIEEYGGTFNRVFVDACINGAIPIRVKYNTNKERSINSILKENEHYIPFPIPPNATPKEIAEVINEANNLERKKWKEILSSNYKLLLNFDRKHCAQQFINLAKNKPAGFFNDVKILSQTDPKIIIKSNKMMKEFFGQEKVTIKKNSGMRKILRS